MKEIEEMVQAADLPELAIDETYLLDRATMMAQYQLAKEGAPDCLGRESGGPDQRVYALKVLLDDYAKIIIERDIHILSA